MYGIIGEDRSDVDTLKVLIRRLSSDDSVPIKGKGFTGCGEMLKKGARQFRLFQGLGCSRFLVCYDADNEEPFRRHQEVLERIVRPSAIISPLCCIVVPVQAMEAWILADIAAAQRLFSGWKPDPVPNPEGIRKPKQHLEKLSRDARHRPRYIHAIHNPQVARHLDLDKIQQKCPSFQPLADFVRDGVANA